MVIISSSNKSPQKFVYGLDCKLVPSTMMVNRFFSGQYNDPQMIKATIYGLNVGFKNVKGIQRMVSVIYVINFVKRVILKSKNVC